VRDEGLADYLQTAITGEKEWNVNLDGLWVTEFSSPGGEGTGIIVFTEGQALGGDTNYYYTGHYSLKGSQLTATLSVTHYHGPLNNVFGHVRSVTLSIEGAVGGDLIMAQGFNTAMPSQRASFRLRRIQSI
jgi:hypothetical protein